MFWELAVPVAPEASEGLTNFLWEQGALGVVEEEGPGSAPRLRAFYPETAAAEDLLAAVRGYLEAIEALGFALPPIPPSVAPVREEAWACAWRDAFPPRVVGRRLLVLAPWSRAEEAGPEAAGRIPLVVAPGRAFGTGHHGSTLGCLLLLERRLDGGGAARRVLDLGSGSGILAIAAAALGTAAVLALDVDPDAVTATRDNVRANGLAHRVRAEAGGPEAVPPEATFDLVLANLLAGTHEHLAATYRRLLAPGGGLILGGILSGEEPGVLEAAGRAGLVPDGQVVVEEWVALALAAPA
jgi:ribosomal protein L11 methyltransferase